MNTAKFSLDDGLLLNVSRREVGGGRGGLYICGCNNMYSHGRYDYFPHSTCAVHEDSADVQGRGKPWRISWDHCNHTPSFGFSPRGLKEPYDFTSMDQQPCTLCLMEELKHKAMVPSEI